MVKVLILLAVILLLWWLVRPRARLHRDAEAASSRPEREPRETVACVQCGLHVPRDEALPGPSGSFYCCEAHRRAAQAD